MVWIQNTDIHACTQTDSHTPHTHKHSLIPITHVQMVWVQITYTRAHTTDTSSHVHTQKHSNRHMHT